MHPDDTGPPATFGAWLQREKQRRNLSVRRVEARAGASLRHWFEDRWPAKTLPPQATIEALARGLGMDWIEVAAAARAYVQSPSIDPGDTTPEQAIVMHALAQRDPTEQRMLADLVLMVTQALDRASRPHE